LNQEDERLEAYRRVSAYLTNPRSTVLVYADETDVLRIEVQSARDLLAEVALPDEVARLGLAIVKHLQIDSLRAEITLFETARAYAAADGRLAVQPNDLRTVAPLALRGRRSSFMIDFFASQEVEEKEINAMVESVLNGDK
jgi:Mg-chelatase subunit ChlI